MDDFDSAKNSSPLLCHHRMARLLCLAALAFVFAASALPARADDDPWEEEETEKEEVTLSEEVQKALDAFTEEAAESNLKKVNELLEKAAEEIAEQVTLDDAGKEKLAGHFPAIVEATQTTWKAEFKKTLTPMMKQYPNPLEVLAAWKAPSFASNSHYASTTPARTAEWTKALELVLSPDQLAIHKKAEEEKAKELRVELEDYFIRTEELAATRMHAVMDIEIGQLKQLAELDEARTTTLKAASKLAIDETIKRWIEEWKEKVYAMEETQRKQRTSPNYSPGIDLDGDENPKKHKAWKDGLAEVLDEAAQEGVKKLRKEIRDQRSQALAMILIDALEPYIGFTTEQRKTFTKRFAKPLLKLPKHHYVAPEGNGYYSLNASQMFALVSAVAETEILPLLDEGQARRWKGIEQNDLNANGYSTYGGSAKGLEIPPAEEMDEIEARRLITAYLHIKAKDSTRSHLLRMEAKVDGVARLGAFDDGKLAMLRTAAKGAARALAANEISTLEQQSRERLKNVDPTDLPARIQQSNNNYYSTSHSATDPELWTKAIDRVLTDEQKKTWASEKEASEGWQKDSKITILMTEVDKVVFLKPEKRKVLEKLLTKVIDDYEPELANMLSTNWHVQGYYCMVPFTILKDKQLAPALEKDQIKIIRSRGQGNFEGMLEQIERGRKQRLKQEKEANKKK